MVQVDFGIKLKKKKKKCSYIVICFVTETLQTDKCVQTIKLLEFMQYKSQMSGNLFDSGHVMGI